MQDATEHVSRGAKRVVYDRRTAAAPPISALRARRNCPCHRCGFPSPSIFERTPLANRWVSERWEPVAVDAADDDAALGARRR